MLGFYDENTFIPVTSVALACLGSWLSESAGGHVLQNSELVLLHLDFSFVLLLLPALCSPPTYSLLRPAVMPAPKVINDCGFENFSWV